VVKLGASPVFPRIDRVVGTAPRVRLIFHAKSGVEIRSPDYDRHIRHSLGRAYSEMIANRLIGRR
jgi:hypothetical protein